MTPNLSEWHPIPNIQILLPATSTTLHRKIPPCHSLPQRCYISPPQSNRYPKISLLSFLLPPSPPTHTKKEKGVQDRKIKSYVSPCHISRSPPCALSPVPACCAHTRTQNTTLHTSHCTGTRQEETRDQCHHSRARTRYTEL